MGRETILFKSEEMKSASEIASVFRQIAEKVEARQMSLSQNGNILQLEFPPQMVLEIKVEEEEGRNKKMSLEVELEWIVGAPVPGEVQIA